MNIVTGGAYGIDGLKVIEFNTINSSGFYNHDICKIVEKLTEYERGK
jgi:hypothetical protein